MMISKVEENKKERGFLILRVWGWSMFPVLRDADYVLLKKRKPLTGEIICFQGEQGRKVVHRLIKLKKDIVITRGDNNFCPDKPVATADIIGTAVAVKRENKIIPLKRKRLEIYFPFSACSNSFLRIAKKLILTFQNLKFYPFLVRAVFKKSNIELEKIVEARDFYFIKAKLNGKYAGHIKIDKNSGSIKELYVKIFYRFSGIEERLLNEAKKLCVAFNNML